MSEVNAIQEPEISPADADESQFDEEALHARRRQYGLIGAGVAAILLAVMAFPWRTDVKSSGRIAAHSWSRIYSEAPGVVREVTHVTGDTVEQGEVIAVLDFDEQHDAVETARLALERERQKLADIDLRLRENSIQREGADVVADSAGQQAAAAGHIDGARLASLDPVAAATLEGVRRFTTGVRAELSMSRSAAAQTVFKGEELYQQVHASMTRYSDNAAAVADHLVTVAGSEAGRQFRFQLEDLRFAYDLTDHSMQELIMKHQLVERGLLATVALREPCMELEREAMELAHSFRALSANARTALGSPAEQSERVRGAEESRRLLASESERLGAEHASVESEVAAAELALRSAERHQGQTAIRAPIRGTLAGESLSRFDAVRANASVGVVEDISHLVLKVHVEPADYRRIEVGQAVESRALDGRSLRGVVVWKTPVVGQAVRDQAWNVLVQLDGNSAGIELGDKVMASINVGRRSLMRQWFGPADEMTAAPRVALVEDPTELRKPVSAAEHDKLALDRPATASGTSGR